MEILETCKFCEVFLLYLYSTAPHSLIRNDANENINV